MARTIGFSNNVFEKNVKPMVLSTGVWQCCQIDWFYNMYRNNVAKTIGFTMIPNIILP